VEIGANLWITSRLLSADEQGETIAGLGNRRDVADYSGIYA
jgi:hypothetical protein